MTINRVVVLACGPTPITKKALRRARKVFGASVEIVVSGDGYALVAPTLASRCVADLAAALADVTGFVVVVRDDVTPTIETIDRVVGAVAETGSIAVARTHCPGAANHADLPPNLTADFFEALPAVGPATGAIVPALVAGSGLALAPHAESLSLDETSVPCVVAQAAVRSRPRRSAAPLLVANLIVRDEEANLPDCLDSLLGLVDRVEVCDTGSADGTLGIARERGAVVSTTEWRHDFAAARNTVLERSRDATWVLWIDADERVICPDPAAMRRALERTPSSVEGFRVSIANRKADGTTSSEFQALRVLRGAGTRFEGAVHEEVRRTDGGHLAIESLSGFGIAHFGYDESVVEARSKRLRNLAIARAGYHADPNAKTAYELARAVRATGGDPVQAAELFEEAVSHAGDIHAPGRAHLLASLAHARNALGDARAAWAHATAALHLVPRDDMAAAVAAEAAHELGLHDDLVALAASIEDATGPEPLYKADDNRARFHSLVATAHVLAGDLESARVAALAAVSAGGSFGAWTELFDAVARTGVDAVAVVSPLFAWDADGDMASAAVNVLDPEQTAELCAAYLEAGGAGTHAVVVGLTAAAVASRADLIARFEPFGWAVPAEIAERLGPRLAARGLAGASSWLNGTPDEGGFISLGLDDLDALIGFVPDAAHEVIETEMIPVREIEEAISGVESVLDLAGVVSGSAVAVGAEVVIAGVDSDPDEVASLVDPAGRVILFRPEVADRFAAAGWTVEDIAPLAIARPPWSEESIVEAARRLVTDADHADVVVVPVGAPPGPEFAVAFAASLPSARVTIAASVPDVGAVAAAVAAVSPGTRVVVAPSSVIPEPSWVQPLMAAEGAAGVGLVDISRTRIHAGADDKARPFGRGARPADHPLFTVARTARLLPPFVTTAGELGTEATPLGRYLGPITAVDTVGVVAGSDDAGLRDALGRTVVVLADGSDQATSAAADAARHAALEAGAVAVVYRRTGRQSAWAARRELASGSMPLTFSQVRPVSLAGALQPAVIVVLGEDSLSDDYAGALAVSPHTQSVYAGTVPSDARLLERVDVVAGADPERISRHIASLLACEAEPVVPKPADIAPVEVRDGVVSVVIPVWNRADLTEACLDSLARHAEAPLEITVVDNGSTDSTPQLLADRDLRVITNATNLGFPKAVNQGIAASTGEFVCVLNNDTEVTPGWLREMLASLEVAGTGLVGPRSNRISGWQEVSTAPGMDDIDAAHRWAAAWSEARSGRSWLVARLVGFCLLGRRATFEQVGAFDESFGIGNFEDDELCARVRRAGLALRVADGSVVLHHGGATFEALGVDYDAVLARAARGFGTRPSSGLLSALVLADDDPRAAVGTAISALAIADRVRIAARQGLPLHQLAADALGRAGVEVVSSDWETPEGALAAVRGLDDAQLLVLAAGEHVSVEDVGRVRSRIETLPPEPIAVGVSGGEEVRVHPPGRAAIAAVGSGSSVRLEGVRIRR